MESGKLLESKMKKPKRILYVLPGYGWAGAELQTMHQINYLTKKENDNIFYLNLSQITDGIEKIQLPKEKITICDKNTILTVTKAPLKAYLYLIRETIRTINKHSITDVIAILPLSHLICRFAKIYLFLFKFKKLNLYTYYRGLDFQFYKESSLFFKLFVPFNSLLARYSDNFSIFNSKASLESIKEHFYVSKPMVIDNCLPNLEINKTAANKYLSVEKFDITDSFSILFPGRYAPTKGHAFFFKAIEKFILENNLNANDFKIIIAGHGSEEAEMEIKNNANRINEFVHFTGKIENDLMLSLMSVVSLIVIPSFHEGFGNVAIEGLMQKAILLTSDAGGLKDIIEHRKSGFQFETGNEEDFLEKLNFIYSCNENLPISKKDIFNRYLQKYSIENYFKKINKIYNLNLKL